MKSKSTIRVHKSGLAAFRSWLAEHGLGQTTCDDYARDIAKAVAEGGIIARLTNDELAPKTRRRLKASAVRWADFTDDDELAKKLKKLRLPPARRKAAKIPIEREQLFSLIDELAKADYVDNTMKGILGMMACRGFRVGDVLRIQKHELERARETGILSFEAKGRKRLEFKLLKTFRRYVMMLADQPGKWKRVDELVSPAAIKVRRKAATKRVATALVKVGTHCGIWGLHPHRLRRTYAVEYLRTLKGDPEAVVHLRDHMQWADVSTALQYVDHDRGAELDTFAEKIFERDE